MRHLLAAILAVTCCACSNGSASSQRAPAVGQGAQRQLDAAGTEVRAIRAAARDATAALEADAPRWEQARLAVVTPLDRALVERRLADHAESHDLELSQFQLLPRSLPPLEAPERIHPAAPYPLRPEEVIVEAPIRFALTPLAPDRIEAFLRGLAELERPLVIVEAVERGMDFVEIRAGVPTFRPLDQPPRYALELPPLQDGESPAGHRELAREVEQTNEALAALSEARLRHLRVQAWEAARERAALHATAIELPPPAAADSPAPRTVVP